MHQSSNHKQSTLTYINLTAKRFLDRKSTGGLLLIASTTIALILGNSQWADAYHDFLKDEFLFGLTSEEWINDGLMAIFFLVAGLALKREIMVGELSSFKKASMPLLAALGGMIVPALIFVALNSGTASRSGWGIPMATDIAYSLGIIGLLGNRVPVQLKVFLVALAIADDIGAILVIAFFYSTELNWSFLSAGAGIFIILMLFNRIGVKSLVWYILGGVALWYCFLNSGIHPTIAGVLLAFTIPVKPKLDSKILKKRIAKNVWALGKTDIENRDPMQDVRQMKILNTLNKDIENAKPPLLKLENALVDFNAFFIIPVFALANAGVKLDVSLVEVVSGSLGLGILLGLAVGKVLGISLFAFIGKKLGISELHSSLHWQHVIGLGMIAGIGFTMSLFVTNLAFIDPELVKVSKISILLASLIGALGGITTLLLTKPKAVKE
ncbi:Na+/H+ antiporter NhaA [Algoriphagus persicinus]|uniref:Na+/H+ antiporter NhaA n=1 Tax=Algoriphagus persicinus TaxID=3108754 RepID=UPI002B3F7D33|nr:Na+/H+ antiporter NhaA [Algoriphagus sp. E1-3-M2]MEB2787103.1 Na+/H+ antiporter NhaA [Algoriphagus sp. E1-3-M2]